MNRTDIIRGGGQVLLLSMRRLSELVAYTMMYEFEDLIGALTMADRVDVGDEAKLEFARRTFKLIRRASGSRTLAHRYAPLPSAVRLDRDYELFFPTFNNPHELYALAAVPDWRQHCRVAVCYVNEVWAHILPDYLLELLDGFDHIFLGMRHCVETVARITGRPCSYLPLAADVLRFSGGPDYPSRSIGVCNIGRRSEVTHEALMVLAARREIFYYYDTFAGGAGSFSKQRTFRVEKPAEHRQLLANLLRRSRFYIANRSRVNEPEYTAGHDEISGRFYEGAAAGTVMLGEPPRTPEFQDQFAWPDAVIRMPFDHPTIGRTLRELDGDPERLARIQCDNMRNAALRHDWSHRLRTVFTEAGMPSTPAMLQRERQLQELAVQISPATAASAAGQSPAKRSLRP